jgi:hypothetical protein
LAGLNPIHMVGLAGATMAMVQGWAYARRFIAAVPLVVRKIKIERISPRGESDYR